MKRLILIIACTILQSNLYAATLEEFQKDWAAANYRYSGKEQVTKFEELDAAMIAELANKPNDPQLIIWQGIIKSTFAGKAGGLTALSLAKGARKSLEQAIEIDEMALSGSAHTSLGALYYQVPGWPIAFGSDKKARMHLEKALLISPDSIDSNYFYADFLYEEGQHEAAKAALKKAIAAKARPGRELADKGRRDEINVLMTKLDKK
jgi:tetratricopeptide (TPR) repeat protein